MIFPARQQDKEEVGLGYGGIYKASLAHVEGLLAAGFSVVIWTASYLFSERSRAMGALVDYRGQWHSGVTPLWSPACWRAAREARKSGVSVVVFQGGRGWLWGKLFFPTKPQVGILHTGGLGKTRRLKYQLALSREAKLRLEKSKPAKGMRIELVQNGLNRDTFDVLAKAAHIREKNRHLDRVLRVGFLGRFAPAKGVDVLIAALGILKKEGVHLDLILGGTGELDYRDEIAQADLAGNVRFLGWINNAAAFYAEIDVFCLPSRFEPFGMVLIEAMASGLPVVATRTGGPLEILESGESGLLVPINDVKSLASALRDLATDAALRMRLAASGKETVFTDYSPEAVGRRFKYAFDRFGVKF